MLHTWGLPLIVSSQYFNTKVPIVFLGTKRKFDEEEISTDGIPSELLKKWGNPTRMGDRDRAIVEACIKMVAAVLRDTPATKPQSVLHQVWSVHSRSIIPQVATVFLLYFNSVLSVSLLM